MKSSGPFAVDADRLWEKSRPQKIAGVDVFVLSPEDALLYLCLHAAIHAYSMGLRVLCDLRQFVAALRAEIDWTRVGQ